MGNIFYKRPQHLIIPVFIVLFSVAMILYLLFFRPPQLNEVATKQFFLTHFKRVDKELSHQVERAGNRARELHRDFRNGSLKHSRLNSREAVVITENQRIKQYWGEIYYFPNQPLKPGEPSFFERRNTLFFIILLETTDKKNNQVYYVSEFCRMDDNFMLDLLEMDVLVAEIKFSREPVSVSHSAYYFDKARNHYSYSHVLASSGGGLSLFMEFSQSDISRYFKEREILYIYITSMILLLTGVFLSGPQRKWLGFLLWFIFLGVLFLFIVAFGVKNLDLAIPGVYTFQSTLEIMVALLVLLSLLFLLLERFTLKIPALILFNLLLLFIFPQAGKLFKHISFNYTQFSFQQLTLIIVVFFIHLIPLFFIRKVYIRPIGYWITAAAFIQAAIIITGFKFFNIHPVSSGMISLAALLLIFGDQKLLMRVLIIFLLSISIYHQFSRCAIEEKKQFVSQGLKSIFLNQNNYAKFIVREIVHQMNPLNAQFSQFFNRDCSPELKSLWQKTLASRENIASGIFIVAPNGQLLSHYAYQMQYIDVPQETTFPFWSIEDTAAKLYGRKVSLAMAYLNVVRNSVLVGRIVVQVINSPELILQHRDKVNIFTLDNRIDGKELSYIKLDEQNHIVENPSNINLENIADMLQYNNRWITFDFIDLTFMGYIFKQDNHTFILFFPGNTIFKDFSGVIRIFFYLLTMFLLFYSRDIRRVDWRGIYYSFSIRVFAILILISLVTAVVFTIFSVNVNSLSSLRQARQEMYERGRTAQNIGYNELREKDHFTSNHLLLISRILNTDVSVYRDGILLEASNYKKIVDNRIPNYLHSNILELLNRKNQKFVLFDSESGFHLYFKIYEYILDVEFTGGRAVILSRESYYTDFIITLFFILILIGISFAVFFRNKIISPINGLNQGMADVEKGNLHNLDDIPSEIELRNLYMGFNSMVEGIREQKKSISEISRMKTIIKLGRRVAHEVKNPLTPIKLSAEQILRTLKDKNPNYEHIIHQSINFIIAETDHLKRVSYGFLDLSKLDELQPQTFDIMGLLMEEVFNYRQIYSRIDFHLDSAPTPVDVTMDRLKIKQVLINIISNSIDAIGEKKGEIALSLSVRDDRVHIEIADNGAGMDEKTLEQIFEIDYSTKEVGSGLGLFIVRRIIELHKGHIRFESRKNEGARVFIELPRRLSPGATS